MIKFRELLPLYAVIFLGFFGYALTITLFIPMIMDTQFMLLPPETPTATRVLISGLLLAVYPLGQFLGSPVIGNFSDHFGRKKVLLVSLIACLLGFVGMALSIAFHQLILLFIMSFLTGLCESNMAISQSVIVERSKDTTQKTKLVGYAYSACSLGYVVGPLVGGMGGTLLGYSAPFWITAIGVLCLILWVFFSLEEYSRINNNASIHILGALTAIKSLFNQPKLRKAYFINFAIFFAIQGLYRVVPLYVVDEWQPSLQVYSLLIAYVSLLCLIANLILLGQLTQRFSTKPLLSALLFISGLLVISITLPEHFNWIWLTYGLTAIITVMALPTCTVWLSEHATEKEQGQVLGNNQALLVLGESSSAAIGGIIAAILVPLPVVIMGLILIATGGVLVRNK